MTDLSDEALAIRCGVFLNQRTELRMGNQTHVLSEPARKGLDELIAKGLVDATSDGIATIYRLTAAGQEMNLRGMLDGNDMFEWMKKHGNFPIAVNIGGHP